MGLRVCVGDMQQKLNCSCIVTLTVFSILVSLAFAHFFTFPARYVPYYHIWLSIMSTFLPKFLREKIEGCVLYVGSTNSVSMQMFLILLFMLMHEKCNSRKQ